MVVLREQGRYREAHIAGAGYRYIVFLHNILVEDGMPPYD